MNVGFYGRDLPLFEEDYALTKIMPVMYRVMGNGATDFTFYAGEPINRLMAEKCPGTVHLVGWSVKLPKYAKVGYTGDLGWFASFCDYLVIIQPQKPKQGKLHILWLNPNNDYKEIRLSPV